MSTSVNAVGSSLQEGALGRIFTTLAHGQPTRNCKIVDTVCATLKLKGIEENIVDRFGNTLLLRTFSKQGRTHTVLAYSSNMCCFVVAKVENGQLEVTLSDSIETGTGDLCSWELKLDGYESYVSELTGIEPIFVHTVIAKEDLNAGSSINNGSMPKRV
jgi:hypothetical protein